MPWIAAGGALLGGLFAGRSAERAADESARAQIESAKIAADAAKFRPYAISTGFGKSYFDTEGQTAGYEMDPRLKAMQEQQYKLANQVFGGLNLDPTQAAQQYYNEQQGLMAGGRTAEDIALRQRQLQSGRIGLGLSGETQGAGVGTGYVNPEQYQRDLARAQSDAQLAAQSRSRAQQEIDAAIARGQGLFTYGTGIEELGMKPLTMGADIGNRAAVAGANQAQALMTGGTNAAQANLAGGLAQANMYQNLGKTIGGMDWSSMLSPAAATPGYTTGASPFINPFGSSLWSDQVNSTANARLLRQG